MTSEEFDRELAGFNTMCRVEGIPLTARRWREGRPAPAGIWFDRSEPRDVPSGYGVGGGHLPFSLEGVRALLKREAGRMRDLPAADAPRSTHEAYANRYGHFWLPCPRCERSFGGHEPWLGGMPYESAPFSYAGTCCPNPLVEDPAVLARVRAQRIARGEEP